MNRRTFLNSAVGLAVAAALPMPVAQPCVFNLADMRRAAERLAANDVPHALKVYSDGSVRFIPYYELFQKP
jgi:hypothetical protein